MWRPKDWEQIKPRKQSKGVVGISEPNFDYGVEAGADAILKELGENYIGKDFYYNANMSHGKLVFIPEEK